MQQLFANEHNFQFFKSNASNTLPPNLAPSLTVPNGTQDLEDHLSWSGPTQSLPNAEFLGAGVSIAYNDRQQNLALTYSITAAIAGNVIGAWPVIVQQDAATTLAADGIQPTSNEADRWIYLPPFKTMTRTNDCHISAVGKFPVFTGPDTAATRQFTIGFVFQSNNTGTGRLFATASARLVKTELRVDQPYK